MLSHISLLGTELDILCKYLLLDYIMRIHSFIHSFIQKQLLNTYMGQALFLGHNSEQN